MSSRKCIQACIFAVLSPAPSYDNQQGLYYKAFSPCYDIQQVLYYKQRWAKGPIDRSSDTDSIFRLYRMIQSVDAKFRFLNRPIVSVRLEFRFFNRPILFLGLKFRFLYRPIVSVRFEFRFLNRPILFFGFKFRFLYRPVLSNKTNAVKMVGNGLAGPSKMVFVETIRLLNHYAPLSFHDIWTKNSVIQGERPLRNADDFQLPTVFQELNYLKNHLFIRYLWNGTIWTIPNLFVIEPPLKLL
jgi:hypothetical protein